MSYAYGGATSSGGLSDGPGARAYAASSSASLSPAPGSYPTVSMASAFYTAASGDTVVRRAGWCGDPCSRVWWLTTGAWFFFFFFFFFGLHFVVFVFLETELVAAFFLLLGGVVCDSRPSLRRMKLLDVVVDLVVNVVVNVVDMGSHKRGKGGGLDLVVTLNKSALKAGDAPAFG